MRSRRATWFIASLLFIGWLLISYLGNADIRDYPYVFEPADHYDLASLDSDLSLRWTFTSQGQIITPIVFGTNQTVYIQSYKALYSLNAEDGSLQWQYPIKRSGGKSIVLFDNLILLAIENGCVLQGLDAALGQARWELRFNDRVAARSGCSLMSRITVDQKRAYILLSLARGTAVIAVDPYTGEILWKAPSEIKDELPGWIMQDEESPYLYLASGGSIRTLSKENGNILKKVNKPLRSREVPTYRDGIAYTNGGIARAVRMETGHVLWAFNPRFCEDERKRTIFEPPILDRDVAYMLTTCEFMAQADLETGKSNWIAEIPQYAKSFEPVGEKGYALNPFGEMYAVDAHDGSTNIVLSLEPPEIDVTTYQHLRHKDGLLILTPGNNQAFAFDVPE